jgi:CRP-like cAMP-binding protein
LSPSANLRLIGPLERALFLKSSGPLEGLTPGQVAVFAEHATERSFRAGQTISRAGRPLSSYHVLVEGRVFARGGEYLDGAEVAARGPVGFLSLVARRPEGLEITAMEDAVTLEFGEDVLLDILEDDFEVTHGLIRRLAKQTLDHRRAIPNGTYLAPREGHDVTVGGAFDLVHRLALLRSPGGPWEHAGMCGVVRIAHGTPVVTFPPGTTLWKTGDRSEEVLIVVSGTVGCTTQWGTSRFRAGPGYPLGNLERLAGEPRWYTAVAETALVALRGDTEGLLDVLEDHFDMSLGLARAMAERMIRLGEENASAGRMLSAASA